MSKPLKIAFDVNGTLTHPEVRRLLTLLDRNRCTVIVWSTMGKAYAQEFCTIHGIEADMYADKNSMPVDIAVDDVPAGIKTARLVLGIGR